MWRVDGWQNVGCAVELARPLFVCTAGITPRGPLPRDVVRVPSMYDAVAVATDCSVDTSFVQLQCNARDRDARVLFGTHACSGRSTRVCMQETAGVEKEGERHMRARCILPLLAPECTAGVCMH